MTKKYDAIVIGAGQGGGPLARDFAQKGKKTLLIEKEFIGGTCINSGCTPTKTMVASAKHAHWAKKAEHYGIQSEFLSINMPKVYQRKQEIVESFRSSGRKRLEETKRLDLVFGLGKFIDSNKIQVITDSEIFTATSPLIIINTGGRPLVPLIPGINDAPYLNSSSIMELQELPDHLIIIGGGYISLEFGQIFRRFGSQVSILEKSERLWMREDPDISESLHKVLLEEGIDIFFQTNIEKITTFSKGKIQVDITSKNQKTSVSGSHLLVATGRSPNTGDLGLEAAGVEIDDRGFIKVNEKLQTSVSHIYAIGDVKGGPMFTHISYDDYRVLRDNLLARENRTIKERMVPYTVFTDPQLGRVGMSEEEAKKANIPYKVAKMPMNYVARAIEIGETQGLMKAVIHAETHEILGCAVLGAEGGEIMSMMQIAMMGKVPFQKLRDGVFAHPTFAESLNNLFNSVE